MEVTSICITVIASICLTLINFITIVVMAADLHLRRLPSNYPIASFLLASAFQGLTAAPLYIYKKLSEEEIIHGSWICDSSRMTYFVCGHVMKWSLLVVSFDRVFAIKYPYKYQKTVTKVVMASLLSLVWIITLGIDVIPFTGSKPAWEDCNYVPTRGWGLSVILIYNIIPFCMMAINYFIIWRVSASFAFFDKARNKSLRQSMKRSQSDERSLQPDLVKETAKKASKTSKLRFALEMKATKTSLILIAVYVVCWGPLGVFYMIDHFCYNCLSSKQSLSKARMGIKLLCFTSSLFAPIIYCWANKGYRKAAKRVLQKFGLMRKTSGGNYSRKTTKSLLAK